MKKVLKICSVSILSCLISLYLINLSTTAVFAQEGEGVTSCTYWYAGPYESEAQCQNLMNEALIKSQAFIKARNKCLAKMGAGIFIGSFQGFGGALSGVTVAGIDCLIDYMM